jgi:hypothetical protein
MAEDRSPGIFCEPEAPRRGFDGREARERFFGTAKPYKLLKRLIPNERIQGNPNRNSPHWAPVSEPGRGLPGKSKCCNQGLAFLRHLFGRLWNSLSNDGALFSRPAAVRSKNV